MTLCTRKPFQVLAKNPKSEWAKANDTSNFINILGFADIKKDQRKCKLKSCLFYQSTSEKNNGEKLTICLTHSHLFCTLISENQGPEKLRSTSNLRKISGPAHLNFFSVHLRFFFSLSPGFFQVYGINLKKIQVTNWKKTQVYWKKTQECRTWNFSKVWNRP